MLLNELHPQPEKKSLLEGQNLKVYEALLPLFLIEEDGGDGGGEAPGDGTTPPEVFNHSENPVS